MVRGTSFSRSSVRVVVVIVHILDDLQVFLEVGVFEVLVLLLVLGRLVQVRLANVLHDVDTLLQRRDGVIVVLSEAQILLVGLHPLEALDLELCAFQVESQIADLLLQLLDLEVDSRGLAEGEGPLEERAGEGQVVGAAAGLELLLHALQLEVHLFDEIERDGGRLVLAHLRDELGVVLEEELHVDGLAILVAQKSDEHLEHLGKCLRVGIFEDIVDLGDDILGDRSQVLLHLLLERARLLTLAPVSVQIADLRLKVRLDLPNMLLLNCSGLLVLSLLCLPFALLLAQTLDLLAHFAFLGGGVMPVIGLQLGDLVHGHLALVTLLLNVFHELLFAHSIELVLDLVG